MEITNQQQEILDQIKEHGGFSIFWVTDNQERAAEALLLEKTGVIQRQKDSYPYCKYEIMGDPITILERFSNEVCNFGRYVSRK